MDVQLICVGRLKERFYVDAAAEYAKRLGAFCRLQIVEVPEERLPRTPSPAQISAALRKEAAVIRGRIPAGACVVALCIEGRRCSSEDFAGLLQGWIATGRLVFLIGGSYGLDEALKQEARFCFSMSPMTFPHHLARVMLLEQVYRAFQIREGSRYHK